MIDTTLLQVTPALVGPDAVTTWLLSLTGLVWVLLAIYMSALTEPPAKARYTWVYFFLGSVMLIIAHEYRYAESALLVPLRAITYLLILYIGIWFFLHLRRLGEIQPPRESIQAVGRWITSAVEALGQKR